MKISGRISWVGDIESGTSQRTGNEWQRRNFVVIYGAGTPAYGIAFSCFDKDMFDKLEVGAVVEVTFEVTVREYNGKYYNDFRILRDGLVTVEPQVVKQIPQAPAAQEEQNDEIPF